MRIPGGHHLAADHLGAFLGVDGGAEWNLVALALAAKLVDHADFTGTRHRHQVALLVLDRLDVVEAQCALVADLNAAGSRGPRGRAADVEGAHRQLRAGLADRLRGDHAHRLADVDDPPATEVAAVAVAAHAVARAATYR